MGLKQYLQYDGRIIADSFNRTASLLIANWGKSALLVLFGPVFTVFRIGILYLMSEDTSQVMDELIWVFSGVGTLIVLGVLSFAWNVATCPYRFWRRDQDEIKRLRAARDDIRTTPELSIAWDQMIEGELSENTEGSFGNFGCFTTPEGKCQNLYSVGGNFINKSPNGEARFINKLVITNHGDTPVFKVRIPVVVEVCKEDEKSKISYIVHTEQVDMFSCGNESIYPGEKMILYLRNTSREKYWHNLHLMGYIEADLFDTDKKVKIKYTWETFRPLAITLQLNS